MQKKYLKSVLFSFGLLLFLTACNKGARETMTTINENGNPPIVLIEKNKLALSIKHEGLIKLSEDKSNFASISPEGYIHYKKGNVKMNVKSDPNGNLSFDLYDGNNSLTINNQAGKNFVTGVINDMISNGFKPM